MLNLGEHIAAVQIRARVRAQVEFVARDQGITVACPATDGLDAFFLFDTNFCESLPICCLAVETRVVINLEDLVSP